MKTKILTAFLLIGMVSFSTYTNAQINIKKPKIKTPKINTNKGNSDKGSSSVGVNKYSKYMDEAKKAESAGDYISAYKAYNNALKEKNNDYSATSAQRNIEDKAEEQFEQKLNKAIENEDCNAYKKTVDDLTATISMTPSVKERWINKKENCETNIKNQKNKAQSEASAQANAEKYNSLSNGSYFEKGFHTVDNLKTASIGDDLWLNIKMGKTMMEYSTDFGIDETFNAYGYFVIYMDGKKVATTKPLSFTSNYSKSWTDFDVPVSISQDYGADREKVTALASNSQGMWVVSNLQNADLLNRVYIPNAIKYFASKNGPHKLKIEFGLGEKGGTAPKGIISSGEITINVNDSGKKELYKKGPKFMRPLDDNEMGKITVNSSAFKLGSNTLTASVTLPHPPKYYAQKWCTTMSCDYDHGNLTVEVDIDGFNIGTGGELWNDQWEQQKTFEFTIIPKNDNELNNDLAPYNKELLVAQNRTNKIIYAIVDLIYSGKIKAGNHKITVSVNKEVTVGNDNIANQIAVEEFNINITQSQINALIASSNAKKLSHVSGWSAVDKHLTSTHQDDHVVDVACYTDWKVTRNSLGVILYRNCVAELLYKTEDGGYRIMQGVDVQEDYNGSSYGKPYFTGQFRTDWGYQNLDFMHFPVPASKVK